MRILITGRAGSGKSAITVELRQRGFLAQDTDNIAGLCAWYHKGTGVQTTIKDNRYVPGQYDWLWDKAILKNAVKSHPDIFICGGADNDFMFDDLFDKHFVLNVSPAAQINRLKTRVNNNYAKDPAMHSYVLAQQQDHIRTAEQRGATLINADQPITQVVNDILRLSGLPLRPSVDSQS